MKLQISWLFKFNRSSYWCFNHLYLLFNQIFNAESKTIISDLVLFLMNEFVYHDFVIHPCAVLACEHVAVRCYTLSKKTLAQSDVFCKPLIIDTLTISFIRTCKILANNLLTLFYYYYFFRRIWLRYFIILFVNESLKQKKKINRWGCVIIYYSYIWGMSVLLCFLFYLFE